MNTPSRYLWFIALLITYGSLYPFTFSPADHGALTKLFSTIYLFGSIGDLLGNVGLFVPLGSLGIITFTPESSPKPAVLKTLAIGLVLALGLQIAQIWVPARNPGLNDVFWNMLGCALGIVLGQIGLARRVKFAELSTHRQLASAIVAAWIVIEWLPLIPSLDFQLIKDHLKDLVTFESLSFSYLFERFGIALLLGELLSQLFKPRLSLILLPILVTVVIFGKLFLIDVHSNPSMALGFAFGVIGWWAIHSLSSDRRSSYIVVALIAAYSISALSPFVLRDQPSSFRWMPFEGLLEGSMLDNVRSLGNSIVLFTSVLLLFRTAGAKIIVASIGLAIWVMTLEIMQLFIATRSATITEPLLVLIVGQVVGAMGAPRTNEQRPIDREPPQVPWRLGKDTERTPTNREVAISAIIIIALIAAGLRILLKLPMIPYNLRELFRADGSIPALFFFALALMWIGVGSVWLARCLNRSRFPGMLLPPMTMAVSLISLALLWSAVTTESIGDIVGSSNRFWFVTNRDIWGSFWRDVFLYLNAPQVIGFVETCIRYWALYTPLIVCLGLIIYVRECWVDNLSIRITRYGLAVGALLVLWLCKAIAFDWSSTDNLNELIAYDGAWGWGGGGYLYVLAFLFCLNAVLIAEISITRIRKLSAIVLFSLTAIPLGWWFINQGLEQRIEKYGVVFSGVQFLLGPDRNHSLSQNTLLLRWCVVQVAGILILSLGVRIGKHWFLIPRQTGPKSNSIHLPVTNASRKSQDRRIRKTL